ncbi:GNAT family N-acetyltransferase [Paenibacillus agilis]|uniref:GNAT family N-acetyltransferase n=1 Tax=Paenibacillus agilis TaxID=3020863 RepID=A0A559J4A7_9BACL|nr:GNAT family N-acetyltransferase [Paenibacillus agilis]TVX94717.1 GNAT family N-acetyltransferase [Paenibacillus agilis]
MHTDRLELVPIDVVNRHAPTFAQYMNNKKHIQLYMEQLIIDPDLLGWGVWLAISKDSNEVIGDIGFKGKPVKETVEVGYGFMPGARNKGYATESVKALVNWAFLTNKVSHVVAECAVDNHPSIKVLKKLGMQRTSSTDKMIYWKLTN